jgi:hypothetical protein
VSDSTHGLEIRRAAKSADRSEFLDCAGAAADIPLRSADSPCVESTRTRLILPKGCARMSGKFHWLVVTALFVPIAASGCHTIGGARYHDVGGVCQKGVSQKGCGGCDGGYRGGKLLSSIHGIFWGCNRYDGCGCGEVYLGEWLYDPPDCCDPCDDCYGQYVGPRDCCKRKWIIDPSLWILAIKHKHCRTDGWYDPCGNWHCHGDAGCCGGCGKGGGYSYGGDVYEGDYLEGTMPEAIAPDGEIDEIPDPSPVPAVRTGRVASHRPTGDARPASHELRR